MTNEEVRRLVERTRQDRHRWALAIADHGVALAEFAEALADDELTAPFVLAAVARENVLRSFR